MNNFNDDMFDEKGFIKSNSGSEFDKFNNLNIPKMSGLSFDVDLDFFNCGAVNKKSDGFGTNSKKKDEFTMPPTVYEYGKRVVMDDIDGPHIGYFRQTEPSPFLDLEFTNVKGVFTEETTGKKTSVTVSNIKHDLNEWGVMSYIFKIFDWGKPLW